MPSSHSHERPSSPPSRVRRKSKQDNMFGPYVLLYTIGEGEFAKVKYGIHSDSGEEAAIKLIRKENVDSDKLSKIKREISVLKSLSHPYIVSLIEVIETQNYIGIVLEYASGGELFDHILAHRYLKEREACRLFAQLICGVDYLHRNKIIHRDLKLENLLLDRNRNIIITDFGFANQFGKHGDDLMATSCGSPCYAAPELVVSDGMYAGSAVDVWSCGVILYAMLAGYLPFDDDPENPEGDNINLLYKYILSTPLSFPDYVGSDARDLLRRMLVPDPTKRCKVKDIMNHRWMSQFKGLFEEFKLKAKLEFVTGTPTPTEMEQKTIPEVSTKSKRHTIQIDSPRTPDAVLRKEILEPIKQEREDPRPGSRQSSKARSHRSPSSAGSQRTIGSKDGLASDAILSSPEAGGLKPLDPFDPSAIVAVSDQPLDPFDPNTTVLFTNEGTKLPEKKSHRSRKEKASSNQVTFPSSTKQSKARPISMQTPSFTKTATQASYKKTPTETRAKVALLASSSPRSESPRTARPASLDPNMSRQPSPVAVVALAADSSEVDSPRRSNRHDTRKAFSAVLDSSNAPMTSQSHTRMGTLSPATTTARRITEWIKRKSIVIKSGTLPSGFPPATPNSSAARESIALSRDNGSIFRLRYHRGAVDQFALTSRAPPIVIEEIKASLVAMGFVLEKHNDYKIKIIRPLRGVAPRPTTSSSRRFTLVGLRDLLQIRPRGSTPPQPRSDPPTAPDSLYGDNSIDNSEEIRLAVELCRIKNFPNLYILDIKRMKGNVWSYKFLYHLILEKLQLNSNGGYLNPGA